MSMLTYLASRDAGGMSRYNSEGKELRLRYAEMAERQKKIVEARQIIQQRQKAVAATHARKEHLVALLRREGSKSEEQIATLEEKAKRLEHLIDVLSRQSAGSTFQEDIRTVQGALGWPVEGRVIETFGRQVDPKFSTTTFNNGLKTPAPAGAAVHPILPRPTLTSHSITRSRNHI